MPGVLGFIFLLSWIQVRSDHFTVISAKNKSHTASVVEILETFHSVPSRVLFDRDEPPHPRIQVLLLEDDKHFRLVVPSYGGGPRQETTGFWQRAQDHDIIVVAGAGAIETEARTICHELTHHFLQRHLKSSPLWLSEGLAEYFEESEFQGNKLTLGGFQSLPRHLLDERVTMPLRELFRIGMKSPEYQDPGKARWFYTQSYAFVHFLLHSRYRDGFKHYLQALASDQANIEEYVQAPLSTLERDFFSYLRSYRGNNESRLLPRVKGPIRASTEGIAPADAEIKLVEVLLWRGDVQQAREHLQKITGIDPNSPYLKRVLDLMERAEPAEPGGRPAGTVVPPDQ